MDKPKGVEVKMRLDSSKFEKKLKRIHKRLKKITKLAKKISQHD